MDKVTNAVNDILEILPTKLENIKSDNKYDEPGNLALVLDHEISMYNQIIAVMHSTLADVLDSLQGKLPMTC